MEFTGSLLHVFHGYCMQWVHWLYRINLLNFKWEMVLTCRLVEKFFPRTFGIFWISSILGVFDDIILTGDNWFSWSFLDFSKLSDFCISWETSLIATKNVKIKFAFASSIWADLLMSVSWMIASSLNQTHIFLGATLSLTQLKEDLLNTHRRVP